MSDGWKRVTEAAAKVRESARYGRSEFNADVFKLLDAIDAASKEAPYDDELRRKVMHYRAEAESERNTLAQIYSIVTRSLAEPPETGTGTLVEIATIIESSQRAGAKGEAPCPTCAEIRAERDELKYRLQAWNDAHAEQQDSSAGARMIQRERERQITSERWTAQHDDEHDCGELVMAAVCYITGTNAGWPWSYAWWKPKDQVSNLTRAGALIAAEIDRLNRLAAIPAQPAKVEP